jgi:hypothetical protein
MGSKIYSLGFFQSFKVQKVVTLGFIFAFFSALQNFKNRMKNKKLSLMILCWLLWNDYFFYALLKTCGWGNVAYEGTHN